MLPDSLASRREALQQVVSDYCSEIMPKQSSDDMCYIMCISLQAILELMGHSCFINQGSFSLSADYVNNIADIERRTLLQSQDNTVNHYWMELEDGTLIDPTADQLARLYGLPELPVHYVGDKPDWYPQEKT